MRRGVLAAMIFAALMAAGTPVVEAQLKIQLQVQPTIIPKLQPKIQPKVIKPPPVVRMPIVVIKPSQAIVIASRMIPNAKPVGVKLLRNNTYVVTLRKNNTVTRVTVDAQTGAAN